MRRAAAGLPGDEARAEAGTRATLRPWDPHSACLSGSQARAIGAVPLTLFMVPVTPPARSPPAFPSGVQGSSPVTGLKAQLWLEAAGGLVPFYSQTVEHGPTGPPEPSRQHAAPDAAASAPGRRAEHWRGSEEGSAPPGHTCGPGEAGRGKGPSQGGPGASIGCAHCIDRRGRAGPAAEGPSPGGAGRPQPGRGPSRQETEQVEGPDATTWRHLSPLGPPPQRPDPRGL